MSLPKLTPQQELAETMARDTVANMVKNAKALPASGQLLEWAMVSAVSNCKPVSEGGVNGAIAVAGMALARLVEHERGEREVVA